MQHLWQTLYDKGEIELREYAGLYCVGCEEFKTERDLVGGKCPLHPARTLETRRETNYFFKSVALLRLARGRAARGIRA